MPGMTNQRQGMIKGMRTNWTRVGLMVRPILLILGHSGQEAGMKNWGVRNHPICSSGDACRSHPEPLTVPWMNGQWAFQAIFHVPCLIVLTRLVMLLMLSKWPDYFSNIDCAIIWFHLATPYVQKCGNTKECYIKIDAFSGMKANLKSDSIFMPGLAYTYVINCTVAEGLV
jgi:hypothetical protein